MKIAVDLTCLSEIPAGLQIFTKNFVSSLIRSCNHSFELLQFSDIQDEIRYHENERINIQEIAAWTDSRVFREQVLIPWTLRRISPTPDRLLIPAYLGPVWAPCPVDIVVHDLEFLKENAGHGFKSKLYWHGLYSRTFGAADRLFPCSDTTAKELKKQLPEFRGKIGPTLYEGLRKGVNPRKSSTGSVPDRKFILFVGTISPRKNVDKLIEAYRSLSIDLRQEYQLHLVGKHGWGNPRPSEIHCPEDGIIWHGRVSDNQLNSFYNEAELLVLPSDGEGFGLPILEAFSADLPVVVSNIDIFREVAGEAAWYLPGFEQPDEWSSVIDDALNNEPKRREKITRGKRRLKKFRWAQSAKKYLKSICAG